VGQVATLEVEIVSIHARRARYRKIDLIEGRVRDDTGEVGVVWFNQPHLRHLLKPGDRLTLHGKAVRGRRGGLQLRNPDVERERKLVSQSSVGVLVPTYPETYGVSSRWLRAQVARFLPLADTVEDPLPQEIVEREHLIPLATALRDIHFPEDQGALDRAQERFGFDELFYPQLAALMARRQRLRRSGVRSPYSVGIAREFVASLPFQLTDDQRRAAHEILTDMDRPSPMNRLLQGDVGSGKTVVAAMAARMAIAARHQVVLMAPTEILARQHFLTLRDLLSHFEIWPRLLVGSTPAAQRREILGGLATSADRLVVGTHALIEDDVTLPDLGLCIVDEQHRFGVAQRLRLLEKARVNPDFLSMTATPIPRSLARTLYGDLDVSQIRQLPPQRIPVETRLVEPDQREEAYQFMREEVAAGRQGFIICPLVEESPLRQARSAITEFERLKSEVLPDLRLTLLHGRLPARDKAQRMEAFANGEFDILVATSIIEVGVDVPNATVMGVEDAERFGLAQLHQFRGRIGRGPYPSHCLLFAESDDPASRSRLQALVDHRDGFELAEIDLRQRGAGEPYGLRQHGLPEMRVGDLLDEGLRKRARSAAEALLDRDPELRDQRLRAQMKHYQVVFEFD
ncbi:MAG TPA: ATP-dependent DNA helicase RecG, partial [Candidatus Saccharimonadales bacterium]|nr:ATP-dependent DNA helicase RecG [Candidatus Saccharimonadales bacterium]